MIEWNKLTWYSKLASIIFFLGVFPILTFYIGMQYQRTLDVVNNPVVITANEVAVYEYGYRCEDGTEFSLAPSLDMTLVHIIPVSKTDKIPEVILTDVETESGVRYEGSGVALEGKGETVTLVFNNATTTCNPMQVPDEAPINFGD